MCGLAGLYLKNRDLQPRLGKLFAPILIELTDRGPDSAGVAVYHDPAGDHAKVTAFSPEPHFNWNAVAEAASERLGSEVTAVPNDTHCVFLADADVGAAMDAIRNSGFDVQVMSAGHLIEIYKETGLPGDVLARFGVDRMEGSHAVGHTRMATESAVTTSGSHPFSTGVDLCLVHNGSLSNHNRLRERLERVAGSKFYTENDTEVAAAYVSHKLESGCTLPEALQDCIEDLDGFYTFVAGTEHGFAVLRDPIACKPAVLAENEDYVAFGSEYRALATLPGIAEAEVWEPEPAIVYSWGES